MFKTDYRIAAMMLKMASDEFGNHGCNDFELPNTPENQRFVKRLNIYYGYPEELNLSKDGTKIYLMDYNVMDYCARQLEAEAEQDNVV